MKKLLTLLVLIALGISSRASMYDENIYRRVGMYAYFTGIGLIPLYDLAWFSPFRNTEGLYLAGSIDPKIAVIDKDLNYRVKVFYQLGRFEPFTIFESYPVNQYDGLSFGVDYLVIDHKLSLLLGLEATRIWNYNSDIMEKAIGFGINAEVRLLTKGRLSASYVGNFETRPEISKKVLYNGYLQINYRIISKK